MNKKNDPRLPGNYMPVKLQIEVGKRYRTRSGDVVEAFTQDKRSGEWKVIKLNGESYWVRENGRLYPVGETAYDLIEQLPADAPA